MTNVNPIAGRIVLRRISDRAGFILGALRLPTHFKILESAGYPFVLASTGLRVFNPPFDMGSPAEIDGWGIDASLQSRTWPAFAASPELMMVRFLSAFPSENVRTVYGATRCLPVPADAVDTWFDITKHGELRKLRTPADGTGLTGAQLLTQLCVWPDAHGTLHCLPQHPSRWRPVYLRLCELTASVGEGALGEGEYYRLVRRDTELSRAAPLHLDREYAKYLARLKAEGGLEIASPMTSEERHTREARATRILRELRLIDGTGPTAMPSQSPG